MKINDTITIAKARALDHMERNAWFDFEYECPVCGLPFRSGSSQRGWILENRENRVPPEFDNEDAIAGLAKNELWLNSVTLLCDPDEEMGLVMPSFNYGSLRDYKLSTRHLETYTSSLPLPFPLEISSSIEEYDAEHVGGPCFCFYEPEEGKIQANVHNWDFPTPNFRPYIPIHSVCLDMAKRVMKSSSHKHLSSMRSLFLALRWRHAVSQRFGASRQEANYTLGPTCWYRPYGEFWEGGDYYEGETGKAQWPGPTQDAEFNLLYTFLSDPVEIESLTDTLLANLEPCRRDAAGDEARSLQARFAALPADIFEIIMSYFRSFRELPRKANHTLPQHFWRNELALASKGLLPWLWDIDSDKVAAKSNEPCPGGQDFEWNWELLVRQLSRGVDGGIRADVPEHIDVYASRGSRGGFDHEEDLWTCTGYDNDLRHVPRGLHNRRRIWQLLEEMAVGDQLPLAGEHPRDSKYIPPMQKCVQLPWTKEGDLRASPIWLPSINRDGAYVRKIGGHVYRIASERPLQYWETDEFRALNDQMDERVDIASVAEILEVIRELGYPV